MRVALNSVRSRVWLPLAAAAALLALPTAPAWAQSGIVGQNSAVVTGFAQATIATAPPGADPYDYYMVNPNGPSARVVDLTNVGSPGTVAAAPKTFTALASQVGQVFGVDARQRRAAEHLRRGDLGLWPGDRHPRRQRQPAPRPHRHHRRDLCVRPIRPGAARRRTRLDLEDRRHHRRDLAVRQRAERRPGLARRTGLRPDDPDHLRRRPHQRQDLPLRHQRRAQGHLRPRRRGPPVRRACRRSGRRPSPPVNIQAPTFNTENPDTWGFGTGGAPGVRPRRLPEPPLLRRLPGSAGLVGRHRRRRRDRRQGRPPRGRASVARRGHRDRRHRFRRAGLHVRRRARRHDRRLFPDPAGERRPVARRALSSEAARRSDARPVVADSRPILDRHAAELHQRRRRRRACTTATVSTAPSTSAPASRRCGRPASACSTRAMGPPAS